jgi:exosome complex component RRP42
MTRVDMVKGAYILEMLSSNVREEQRGFKDYRKIRIDKDFIPHAEGSAKVKIGETDVLVGVKLGLDKPMPDKPEEGNLMVTAELLPLASTNYEAGPPSPESIEFARVVDRGIRAAGIVDTKSLFIEEEKVWTVFVDMYVLNYDGNLFDAGTLACMAALMHTKMPRYEDENVIREGNLSRLKFGNVVTSCTSAKIRNKILLDPNGLEESVMDARLTIANDEGAVRAMQKGLKGAFTAKEVDSLIEEAFEKSKELRNILNNIGD